MNSNCLSRISLCPDGVVRNPRESSHNLWEGKLLMNSMSRSRPTPELRQRAYLPSSSSGHCVELDSRLRISGFQLTYSICTKRRTKENESQSFPTRLGSAGQSSLEELSGVGFPPFDGDDGAPHRVQRSTTLALPLK